MSAAERQNFIDWMKTIGMFLIVTGHVIGGPFAAFNQISQPAYTKQLGVAFFVFIAGWGLANVTKPSLFTVYKRLYAIFAYGILFAIFFSAYYYLTKGELQLSNYSPFVFGANVLFNNFPANPTTWYIGTYFHIVLFWFVFLRKLTVSPMVLIGAFLTENIIRIALLAMELNFVAYMLFPNWLTVFMLGQYLHNTKDNPSPKVALMFAFAWGIVAVTWSNIMPVFSIGEGFPQRQVGNGNGLNLIIQSLLISIVYLLSTWLFFELTRRLPSSRVVQFLSRNTIIVFIIHIPIIFDFHSTWYRILRDTPLFEWRQESLILLVYILTMLVSEIITKVMNLERWKGPLWNVVSPALVKLGLTK